LPDSVSRSLPVELAHVPDAPLNAHAAVSVIPVDLCVVSVSPRPKIAEDDDHPAPIICLKRRRRSALNSSATTMYLCNSGVFSELIYGRYGSRCGYLSKKLLDTSLSISRSLSRERCQSLDGELLRPSMSPKYKSRQGTNSSSGVFT